MIKNFNFKNYGSGKNFEKKFKHKYGINSRKKVSIVLDKFKRLFYKKSNSLNLNKQLFNSTKENIEFLKQIKSYKGMRHRKNYPVRGQRTRTNANAKIFKKKTFRER